MSKDRNPLRAGLFIVISIALIVGVILSIKGIKHFFEPTQTRLVSFKLTDDIGGLRVGDEVRIGGYKVGSVESIEILPASKVPTVSKPAAATATATAATRASTGPSTGPSTAPASKDDGNRIVVTFSLPDRYRLSDDAAIGVQGTLTGTSWLNIEALGNSGAAPPAGVAFVGKPSVMNSLFASLGEVAPEIQGTLRDVRRDVLPRVADTAENMRVASAGFRDLMGDDPRSDLKQVFANLNDVTGDVKELTGDAETKANLKKTVANAKDLTAKANGLVDDLRKQLDEAEGTLGDVKATIANTKLISREVKDLLTGNRGKLDAMISALRTTGENLKAATGEMRHSPWRLLYRPQKGEVNNLNLYDAARQFSEGATQLNDAATALRDAMKNENPNPEQIEKLLKELDESFANFRSVEEGLWSKVEE